MTIEVRDDDRGARCTLTLLHTYLLSPDRDELRTRPSAAPAEIADGIIAGQDLVSGGTWLGYTRDHLFVAVTNRRSPVPTSRSHSRGQLALTALKSGSLQDAEREVARAVAERSMAGFNLVAIQGDEGLCMHFDGTLRTVRFGPGIHVVSSNVDLDNPTMPEKRVLDQFVLRHPGVPSIESSHHTMSRDRSANTVISSEPFHRRFFHLPQQAQGCCMRTDVRASRHLLKSDPATAERSASLNEYRPCQAAG
jgi:hypothetical protein